ncbi:MAG: hypothetical protein KDB14_19270 [Planctomycetales bacterium]|nr:hypothetical protein [Planctomycetales bacterium]
MSSMLRCLIIASLLCLSPTTSSRPASAADSSADSDTVWEGQWNNRKYNTTGPLRCTGLTREGNQWKATFSGTFMGDPFKYEVAFDGKPGKGRTELQGQATLDGDRYQWSGQADATTIQGQYKSLKGYYGTFTLKKK